MPCSTHNHKPWPTSGTRSLHIEACETMCGWCDYETKAANNLRVHARRHILNSNNASLSNITIVTGKAGRSRVSSRLKNMSAEQQIGTLESKLLQLETKTHSLELDNERLQLMLQRAQTENEILRAASTLTTVSLPPAASSSRNFDEDSNRMQQNPLERTTPTIRTRESVSSDSHHDHQASASPPSDSASRLSPSVRASTEEVREDVHAPTKSTASTTPERNRQNAEPSPTENTRRNDTLAERLLRLERLLNQHREIQVNTQRNNTRAESLELLDWPLNQEREIQANTQQNNTRAESPDLLDWLLNQDRDIPAASYQRSEVDISKPQQTTPTIIAPRLALVQDGIPTPFTHTPYDNVQRAMQAAQYARRKSPSPSPPDRNSAFRKSSPYRPRARRTVFYDIEESMKAAVPEH